MPKPGAPGAAGPGHGFCAGLNPGEGGNGYPSGPVAGSPTSCGRLSPFGFAIDSSPGPAVSGGMPECGLGGGPPIAPPVGIPLAGGFISGGPPVGLPVGIPPTGSETGIPGITPPPCPAELPTYRHKASASGSVCSCPNKSASYPETGFDDHVAADLLG